MPDVCNFEFLNKILFTTNLFRIASRQKPTIHSSGIESQLRLKPMNEMKLYINAHVIRVQHAIKYTSTLSTVSQVQTFIATVKRAKLLLQISHI